MDFFQSQDVARRKTTTLVVYFALAVALIIAAVYAVLLPFCSGMVGSPHDAPYGSPPPDLPLWNPQVFGLVSLVTLVVVLGGSIYKIAALRGGGEAVARMLGGEPLDARTADWRARRLLNVVEEMAIASGTPVPPVFLMPEAGINAFAAGYSPDDAVIGVTRGTMEKLTRDELQGVIAHEFSHILNGDMRLNIRLMGVVFGILCIAILGRILMRTHGRKNPLPYIGFGLLIIGSIGVFFGKLIKSAVSRQREFLADASAVQYTRNPTGIAGALKKIGGLAAGSRLDSPQAEEVSHMFFANGMRSAMASIMATHPPLAERIRRIDPSFDGSFAAVQADASSPDERGAGASGLAPAMPPPLPTPAPRVAATPPPFSAGVIVSRIGAPQPAHVAFAGQLLATLDPAILDAARDVTGARALLYALLCTREPALLARQRDLVAAGDPSSLVTLETLLPRVAALPRHARLPLLDIALGTMRRLSVAEYDAFCSTMLRLVEADAEIDLFEFALQHMVVRHLDPHFGRRQKDPPATGTLADVLEPAVDLFSCLAYYGHDAMPDANRAFRAGFVRLQTGAHRELRPLADCGLSVAGQSLDTLATAAPLIKKRVLEGCVAVVAADGHVRADEAELLRAIADALGCPAPPVLPEAA